MKIIKRTPHHRLYHFEGGKKGSSLLQCLHIIASILTFSLQEGQTLFAILLFISFLLRIYHLCHHKTPLIF